jgi:hypothetical protein
MYILYRALIAPALFAGSESAIFALGMFAFSAFIFLVAQRFRRGVRFSSVTLEQ